MDKRLFQYKNSKKTMMTIGILTFLQAIAIIVQSLYLAKAIIAMYERAPWAIALSYFFIFFVALIIRHFLVWLKSRIAYKFADQTAEEMQQQLVEKIFLLGPNVISKKGSGQFITLCLEGIASFRTYLELFIPRFLASLFIPALLLIYVFTLDIASAIILLVVMPILIAFLILLGLVAKKQKDAKWANYLLLASHFVDSLRGLLTLKFLGRSKGHRQAIYKVSNKYRISTIRTLRVAFLSGFALEFFSSLSVAVVAVELGIRLINGTVDFLPALTVLILAPEYFTPVRDLGNDYHATMDGKEAGKKIHQLLEMKNEVDANKQIKLPQWDKNSELSVKNLEKVSDEENRLYLQDVSFHVKGYQKVGIIGLSGSGKSTLIELLSGFLKLSNGEITVNGKQIPHFSIESWQEQITYIPQHPYIFSGTVAENIAWYKPDASRDDIVEVIRKTGLSDLIASFPAGLDEKIGQGGRTLSGGEEQRIALARSLLTERPILLFDEPTAHLDIETEFEIKEMMLPLLENKLVFFATHRLHWMNEMDYCLVMDDGRLIESGTPAELMQKNGMFAKLVHAHRGGTKFEVF